MIINTERLGDIAGLTGLRLRQSGTAAAELSLEFAGHVPTREEKAESWLADGEPVILVHKGEALFAGRITKYERSASPDGNTTSATASDAFWLLDHLSLGAQVAELQAASEDAGQQPGFESWLADKKNEWLAAGKSAEDVETVPWQVLYLNYQNELRETVNASLSSWEALAESFEMETPLWTARKNADGTWGADSEGRLRMDVSRAHYSAGGRWAKNQVVTAWTALMKMRQSNPDCLFVMQPSGELDVISILHAEELTLTVGNGRRVMEASGIAPRLADAVSGVCLLAQVEQQDGGTYWMQTVHPEGVDMADARVKIFQATLRADVQETVEAQAAVLREQIKAWWEAASVLQWSGSVRLDARELTSSPLGKRLSIAGEGVPAEWAGMRAIVSEVSWDFAVPSAPVVELTLGMTLNDPELIELEGTPESEWEPEDSESSESSSDDKTPGGFPNPPERPSSSSTEYGGWEYSDRSEESSSSSDAPPPPPDEPDTDVPTTDVPPDTDTPPGPDKPGSDDGGQSSNNASAPGCHCSDNTARLEEIIRQLEERVKILEESKCDSHNDCCDGSGTSSCAYRFELIDKQIETIHQWEREMDVWKVETDKWKEMMMQHRHNYIGCCDSVLLTDGPSLGSGSEAGGRTTAQTSMAILQQAIEETQANDE